MPRILAPLVALAATAVLITPALASAGWTNAANMAYGRALHTATSLPDGRVLVTGGDTYLNNQEVDLATSEIYNPNNGTWSLTGSMQTGREAHTARLEQLTVCDPGCHLIARVLVAGG